jgi:hypothetical protein
MNGRNEQMVAINFCFEAGLSMTETLVLVQKAYGNEDLNWSKVLRWYSGFWDGRELVEDDKRGGCPKSTWTEVNVAALTDFVKNEFQIASRMIAEYFNIPKTVVLHFWMRIWEREICVHVLFQTSWHLSKGKTESHLTKTLSWWPIQTKIF